MLQCFALAVRQYGTGGQRGRIEHQQRRLHGEYTLPWRRLQLRQQLHRMAETGGLDEQPVRPRLAQQTRQADLERHPIDAAQAAAGDFTQGDAIGVIAEQCSVQTDLAEFVDQHRPTLARRTLAEQMADQAGLAGAQWAADHMGGNLSEHRPMVPPDGRREKR
ncbi:hypothetical protein D9M71_248050 [compost metagenome]